MVSPESDFASCVVRRHLLAANKNTDWFQRDYVRRCRIRYGGRFVMRFNPPRQSKMTSTLPDRSLCSLLTLSRIRCMAIRLGSSPLYAFATNSTSEKDPTIRPCSFEHSMTKAAEHRFGYNSRIYDPSVTATSESSAMESCIHDSPLHPIAITSMSVCIPHKHHCDSLVTNFPIFSIFHNS